MAFWVCDQHASINTHAASSCAAQIGSDACAIHLQEQNTAAGP